MALPGNSLPHHIGNAAANGDKDTVFAWLDAGGAINDKDDQGYTLLTCVANGTMEHQEHNAASLSLCQDLIARGADVNLGNANNGTTPLHFASMPNPTVHAVDIDGSFAFARQMRRVLLDAGADINVKGNNNQTPLICAVGFIEWDESRRHRHRVALVSELLRAGASLDIRINMSEAFSMAGLSGRFDSVEDLLRAMESNIDGLRDNEHWAMIRSLVEGVRAAGGTWAAYARLPRRRVLRLRSLMARGRARTADPIIEPVFRLPNEMCWHVLKFWRATCPTTGGVL